ncbi:DUF2795 domain-containing protein [Saccharopolyspora dendranthemae]|uniref:Uncharacterized protein DUF2795 n=1 Tax=Saccharopolyspora dendranthemae TaxID=1181886 RepID=A0A561V773_9PSEU|nr:DUF2795 domain-containing protein [Saccharopolyspora dendranthemae]TWG07454.1 uncharacterized protein DUF2795 [Saccharopolyspora dendranthemae]
MLADRADMLRVLSHVQFPATRREIVQQCEELGAGPEQMDRLDELPEGTYVEADTVLQALPHPMHE